MILKRCYTTLLLFSDFPLQYVHVIWLTCAFGYSDGLSIQKSSSSFSGREQLIKDKIIDHTHNWLLIERHGNGYSREGKSEGERERGREREREREREKAVDSRDMI